jgi:hypothetical protein
MTLTSSRACTIKLFRLEPSRAEPLTGVHSKSNAPSLARKGARDDDDKHSSLLQHDIKHDRKTFL